MPDSTGEKNLAVLLAGLEPVLLPGQFVFCTVASMQGLDLATLAPLASFQEAEGLSLILPVAAAESAGLSGSAPMRCITLGVHSSLEAVGLTAAVATVLADAGLSANVVAAYHHDHVFVTAEHAQQALALLHGLSAT